MINYSSTDKWDRRWMFMAQLVATWSKDPRTQVGAVLVRDRRILATGFNGFPSGTSDSPTIYDDRPEKIKRVVHAEANAVAQAAMFGHATQGATCFATFPVCCKCAGLLIQAGVARIVIPEWNDYDPIQHEYLGWPLSMDLFAEAGVILDSVDMETRGKKAAPLDLFDTINAERRERGLPEMAEEGTWSPVIDMTGRGDAHGRS